MDAFGLDLVFLHFVSSLVLQEALREVTEKTARTDEDAKNIVKSTRELHQAYFWTHQQIHDGSLWLPTLLTVVQVITEVRQRLSCFDTELKDAKRGSENMQQAPQLCSSHRSPPL